MKKVKIIVVSGFMRCNFDKVNDKITEIIDKVNREYNYNKDTKTYEDIVYLEMYPTKYQDKDVTGVDIKIIKPTNKLVQETYKRLKKDMLRIFNKRLTILVKADKEKIF